MNFSFLSRRDFLTGTAAAVSTGLLPLSARGAGFNGPIMVECCKLGGTVQETMENARANRLFLEKGLASV